MKKVVIEIVKNRAKKLYTPASMLNKIQWRARVLAKNGEVVWVSETYERRAGAKKAVAFLLKLAESSVEIREVDETK